MVAQVEYSVTERSRGRVTLCVVYIVHVKTRSISFLVEHQNYSRWFILKTTVMIFSGLTSKSVTTVFSDLASKPVVTVSPV
jgi:lipoate synthase